MKEILKSGGSLFFKLVVVNIMCIFIVMSFMMIFNGLFTENIGFYALGATEGSDETTQLYTHYYADGEDTKRAEYEAQGYAVSEVEIRSELSNGEVLSLNIIIQLFCIMLTYTFIYPNMWHMGTKDSNLVKFKHKKEDLLKGLKIGAIAVIPFVLTVLFFALAPIKFATNFPISIYRLCCASLYSIISLVTAGKQSFGDINAIQVILLILIQFIPTAIATLGYYLGAKNISVSEKFIYKKNKTKA